MPKDVRLTHWSNVLLVLAVLTMVYTIAIPIYVLIFDGVIGLAKDHGKQIWTTTFHALPVFERVVVLSLNAVANVVWVYGIWQIARLAIYYRQGKIFEQENAHCFLRLGVALGLIGIILSADYPITNLFLHWRGISPWLGDMDAMFIIHPDYIMAGIFFFIIGRIMRRAGELEESDRLIV